MEEYEKPIEEIFNMYYINFDKVFEIKSIFNNEVKTSKTKEKIKNNEKTNEKKYNLSFDNGKINNILSLKNGIEYSELYKNSETMAIASGNFANKKEGDTITLLSNQILNTSKDTYTLYIYIDGNVDNPSTMAGKNFLFKLWGSGEGAIYKENVITTPDNPSTSTS